MYRKLKALTDTYITDKLIRGTRRLNSNVGQAGTLDLFKLHGVNSSGSYTGSVNEISRLLIKFDLSELHALTSSILNLNHSSFKCYISLKNIQHSQTTPSNFTVNIFPLSRSFDEGIGKDVVYFNDIDSANFVTSSFVSSLNLWALSGANKHGLLGSSDIDYISSGNLNNGSGVVNLSTSQTFSTGQEDLLIDVTTVVSATMVSLIPDHGFRIAYTSTLENDKNTYFVKRFGARQAYDANLRPQLIVKYDDTVQSNEGDFFFDISGSLFLFNYNRNGLANLTSGSVLTPVEGANCLTLKLLTSGAGGTVSSSYTISQHQIGTSFITGMYSASFCLNSTNASLRPLILASSSVKFVPIWGSLDGKVAYLTGSTFSVSPPPRTTFRNSPKNLTMTITNMRSVYLSTDKPRLRVFVQNNNARVIASKLPVVRKSMILTNLYYSIRDVQTGWIVVPFDTADRSTLLSTDSDGMYFDIFATDFIIGKTYTVDILHQDNDVNHIYMDIGTKFRIDK